MKTEIGRWSFGGGHNNEFNRCIGDEKCYFETATKICHNYRNTIICCQFNSKFLTRELFFTFWANSNNFWGSSMTNMIII